MKQNKPLPGWCRILDGLISEIAKEQIEDRRESRESNLAKSKRRSKGND